ncbi:MULTISPECIES: hypothetical protein [unclassified Clostridium]|uniref:hypothetical protein n=1 Tax=unclassified Clostridium TaxID=2614128 RepID=UPI003F93A198
MKDFAKFFHVNNADSNLVLLPEDMLPEAALMAVAAAKLKGAGRIIVVGTRPNKLY